MRKIILISLGLLLFTSSFAQHFDFYDECIETDTIVRNIGTTYNSEMGHRFPPKGTYRMLVIFGSNRQMCC